jgi:hypothetical protein
MTAHICPQGSQTVRAKGLATMTQWLFNHVGELTPEARDREAEQVGADRLHMAQAGLCEWCGFPLDNSTPHPMAPLSAAAHTEEQG